MKQQVCKLWFAGIINTKTQRIRLLEHFQTLNSFMRTRRMQAYPLQILLYGERSPRVSTLVRESIRGRRFHPCDNLLC